jgi:hypothetical protein
MKQRATITAVLVLAGLAGGAHGAEPPVTLAETDTGFTLANGHVTARFDKRAGTFALTYQGVEVVGRGYWPQVGRSSVGDVARFGTKRSTAVRIDPATNDGRQLWEIGTPNRSAEEFRHGDDYWHWGLYHQYPKEFPGDVHFVVGKSDPRRDWNYCQPPRVEGRRVQSTTWSVTFELPEAPRGKAALRLAVCGSSGRGGVEVAVNGKPAGGTGPLPGSGVMHRDGVRGYWCERAVAFDAALLKRGTNVLTLTVPARSWVDGVLYDYLRLELAEARGTVP